MKKALCFISFFLLFLSLSAQKDTAFVLDSFPQSDKSSFSDPSLAIKGTWKYMNGDDLNWASPTYNDTPWKFAESSLDLRTLSENTFTGIAWFRTWIHIDTLISNRSLALMITQSGASEIYLNGKLIHSFGLINADPSKEERFDPQLIPVDIIFPHAGKNLIAVRYSNATGLEDHRKGKVNVIGFEARLGELRDGSFYKYSSSNIVTAIFTFYFTFFLALSFLHFVFFLFYRTNRSNLYYSIFAGAFGTVFLLIIIQKDFLTPDIIHGANRWYSFLSDIYIVALLAMLNSIFYKKMPKIFWLWFSIFALDFLLEIFYVQLPDYIGWGLTAIFAIESLRIIITAIIQKKEGSWILGTGIITTILFFVLFFILAAMGSANYNASGVSGLIVGLVVIYATLSIPISMTIFLARDFSRTSKNLSKKLIEVEELSAKNIEQEKEKQKILEGQKELLEVQVKERTAEIIQQKHVIEEKNKDITDSINYAKTIQEAILPDKEIKYRVFPNAFVLFKPKDIVSGDFYWFTEKNGKRIIAACDCTGHGVPGALMSMIGNNVLHQIVNENGITGPSLILDELNKGIIKALKQEQQTERKDGMDVALLTFVSDSKVEFAGAQRPLWIIRNSEHLEIKGDKFAIGGIKTENEGKHTNHVIDIQKDDVLYIFSDGYADQFSDSDKKLMTKRFKEILLEIHQKPLPEQEKYLDDFIEKWKGRFEQTDDILVIGIKI